MLQTAKEHGAERGRSTEVKLLDGCMDLMESLHNKAAPSAGRGSGMVKIWDGWKDPTGKFVMAMRARGMMRVEAKYLEGEMKQKIDAVLNAAVVWKGLTEQVRGKIKFATPS